MKTLVLSHTQEEFEAYPESLQSEILAGAVWGQVACDEYQKIQDDWNMGFCTEYERNNALIEAATKKEDGLILQFAFKSTRELMPVTFDNESGWRS